MNQYTNRKRNIASLCVIAVLMTVSLCAAVVPAVASSQFSASVETQQEDIRAEFVRFTTVKIQINQNNIRHPFDSRIHTYIKRFSPAGIHTIKVIPAREDLLYLHFLKLF